ncbi:(2Fe-2S) ferredoxin domain-containing protein [Gloeocapsa sp. PCC 73106]|uniref:(2Fe-2S) ferredoxin domain-containing protein n=1 Tax=Gloeocapsa sp. PCC 73106 TaxID=102232 RepID=UPI0002AC96DF|nr:(2Fe-2S) ferredoxin domain-containing protein [Gloeocapsa sp. PCC 73106]ELR98262.1 Respiratory-chain NADH dehydrogenase 24 Kd subunit [Gloeocapsa sp. PCC 73106]
MKTRLNTDTFTLTGELKGFIYKDGYKLKYLRLAVANTEYWIKPRKEQRQELERAYKQGDLLKITGEKTICYKTGKLKLKADVIESNCVPSPNCQKPSPSSSILICQKSSCWRQGGADVYAQLTEQLAQRGLSEQVKIKTTGCLKKCKKGPNLVFLPDRAYYSHVNSQQVEELLTQHLGCS